ncbi:extensin-like [Humulus lupulus]|uniref:extensin-like n=1 Tax=Humulus lupulus TaxID=3486 RepID=UPI002B416BB7|nr:extensin-like [Humulus lupulus]
MTNIEKSIKELVTKRNLRLVGLLAPHQDMRESTVRSTTGGEIPEQHQDVSQPPIRWATGVTIREPSSLPRAAAIPTQHGKGKQKIPEHPEPILESSNENVMPFDDAFGLDSLPKATAPTSRKKESRRHPGESSSDPSKKRAQTEDPPTPVPSKETTPPPALIDQTPPLAPIDPTPPPTPIDQTPPDQSGNTP